MQPSFKYDKYELKEKLLQTTFLDFKYFFQNKYLNDIELAMIYLPLSKEGDLLFHFIELILKEMGCKRAADFKLATEDQVNEFFVKLQKYVDKADNLGAFL